MPPSQDKVKRTKPQQKAEAEALFNSIGDGAIATDEFGRITRVNPIALELLGFNEEELIGQWFPKIIIALNSDDSTVNLIDRAITKAALSGKPVSEKYYYRQKNGHKLPVSVNASPIILNDVPLGSIVVFRDITFEEQVDRMKSEFISLASHQLRTPLSAVKTYSHMLSDGYMGELTADQNKALNTIITATNRMNQLISTLLNITRIESGTIAIAPKQIDLTKLVEEVIAELNLTASHKSINITFKIKGRASPAIKSDSLIIKEILTNLVSNAIKYSPEEGEVEILLNPRKSEVLFHVSDSGWGIPKLSHDQVFSKFFRAQNIVKRETTGTGLGLYLVKGLLDELGGKIWFESTEDDGTSFYFTLPRELKRGGG